MIHNIRVSRCWTYNAVRDLSPFISKPNKKCLEASIMKSAMKSQCQREERWKHPRTNGIAVMLKTQKQKKHHMSDCLLRRWTSCIQENNNAHDSNTISNRSKSYCSTRYDVCVMWDYIRAKGKITNKNSIAVDLFNSCSVRWHTRHMDVWLNDIWKMKKRKHMKIIPT